MLAKLTNIWRRIKRDGDILAFPEIFEHFQALLEDHHKAMELIADLGEKSGGDYIFDRKYLVDTVGELHDLLLRMVKSLNLIASNQYTELYSTLDRIFLPLEAELHGRLSLSTEMPYVVPLEIMPLDNPELTGGKANGLGVVIQRLHLPVPEGFVITTKAFRRFMEHNRLDDSVHAWLESWISEEADLRQVSRQIQYSMLAGVVPNDVARKIEHAAGKKECCWSLRSSAHGEGGRLSFAGLHESVLNVSRTGILEAYKRVLTSLYSPEALSYRQEMGMMAEEAAMAVLCQSLVQSEASGVAHTLDAAEPDPDRLVVYAALGLGRTVAEGKGSSDRYIVGRKPPYPILISEIARKELALKPASAGGEEWIPVPIEGQRRPSIPEESVRELAQLAMTLERYFKCPQEMEWAVDSQGRCWILQNRPLAVQSRDKSFERDICTSCSAYRVIAKDKGVVAHAGVGCGPVYFINSDKDLGGVAEGAVLVSRYSAPWLAPVVPKASAIVTEKGSPAGHLAAIAREFRVPALFEVDGVTQLLYDGLEITLDTHQRIIYEGRVQELLYYELLQSTSFEEAPEFRLLRRILRRVAFLNLVDPEDPGFTPMGCKTLHDVIRLVHEKAIEQLIDLPRFLRRFKGVQVWSLASKVPLGLKVMDLGGGIAPDAQGKTLSSKQIRSRPLVALWEGLSSPGVWSTEPIRVDFKGMMSSVTKTIDETSGAGSYSGINLAVVSETYMNLHLRLGYHFNLIDARMKQEAQHNHVYFRFVGGVTEMSRRSRRAQLLSDILERCNFKVNIKGDLVIARIAHLPQEDVRDLLVMLGRLIGFTRQLDIQLRTDRDVTKFADAFFVEHALPGNGSPRGKGGENERGQTRHTGS